MAAMEYDDISNKSIAAHLSRQDGKIEEIRELLQDSINDRKGIHEKINEMIAERARLLRESVVYQDAIEQRLSSVEGRDDIIVIRAAVERLLAVNALSLGVHDWLTRHRVRVRLMAVSVTFGVPIFSVTLNVIAHRLGWV